VINWVIKAVATCEMSEGGWKVINWLVEVVAKSEMSERGGR
jgi:hypothetical protein